MLPAQIGRYRIQRVLGSGGMGTVYEGVHETLGRRAAIKVLHAELALAVDVARRFLDEARASSQVEHPSIVQVYDFGEDPPGVPYLAMELLKGESLAQRLQQVDRPRDLPMLLRFLQQAADALAWAHHVGVIHRDIKPENVFIVEDLTMPDGERAKIVDFGLAKSVLQVRAADPTPTGVPMGTPLFMPPEQWLDAKRADDKSDAYSFGVMLYEVISGRLPFVAPDPEGLLERHLQDEPRSIRDVVPGLPAPLVELVHTLLAKQREHRPTMKAVAASLLRILSESSEALAQVGPPSAPAIAESPPRERALDQRGASALPVDAHAKTAPGIDGLAKTEPQAAAVPQERRRPVPREQEGPSAKPSAKPSALSRGAKSILRAVQVRRPAEPDADLLGRGFAPDELREIEEEYRRGLQRADLRMLVSLIWLPALMILLSVLARSCGG